MSDNLNKAEHRLGYLLLRDGHAVPLRGISPDDIKAGAKHRVLNPDNEPLRHRQTLNAIVDRLGFSGDFGTFLAQGWPQFQRFLKQNNCTHRTGVFPVDHGGCIDLNFGEHLGPRPRQLADRIFEAGLPIPSRVFLGYGVDWAAWDSGMGYEAPEDAIASLKADKDTARQRAHDLFARRLDLMGQWGFLDDKLVHGPLDRIVDKSYWPPSSERSEREAQYADVVAAVRAFRAVFDVESVGWVDVLHYNHRLVVLRGHDGGWDLLWRNYREKEPPQPEHVGQSNRLAVEDLPSRLMGESDLRRAMHFRQEVWEENEEHEAQQAFYDRGRSIRERQMTSDADVRIAWLREQGKMPKPERVQWSGPLPNGFRAITVNGRKLAISEVINVGSFRQMLVETGYADRRADTNESWERANEGEPDDASVGASWVDAQAYCAWRERQLGASLRLPTQKELRALRPAYSRYYARMADRDFPWENYPPRPLVETDGTKTDREVPSAVIWSEPRFLEPGPDLPAHPESSVTSQSRKRWIEDFPPRATWRENLPWAEYQGLRFIDAWDAYEWCQERELISGRFWEGNIGATSWGAYKNVKVTFRIVLDLEG